MDSSVMRLFLTFFVCCATLNRQTGEDSLREEKIVLRFSSLSNIKKEIYMKNQSFSSAHDLEGRIPFPQAACFPAAPLLLDKYARRTMIRPCRRSPSV